jgi:Fic family protein
MIFEPPPRSSTDLQVLSQIDGIREELRFYLREPRRWYGTLRRATFARAVQGSNSIEGYRASVADVVAVLEDEEPLTADEETRQAIAGYRDALTYVLQLAGSPPEVDVSLVKSLHFMMMKYDLSKHPGQWRPGAIWVEDETGINVYAAPDRELVDALMDELLGQINTSTEDPMIRAAMAHLNLAMIHPFSDGNGRMARCLQTLALTTDGISSPVFSSIEAYLGRNTDSYYRVLAEVGQGEWNPQNSARPWIEFTLIAHLRQAHTMLRQVKEMESLWDACEQLVAKGRLPSRSVGALVDASRGLVLHRSLYKKLVESSAGESMTDATATRDLRALSNGGLLDPQGEKRGRRYVCSSELATTWLAIRDERRPDDLNDPYVDAPQPSFPGLDR